jgi:hypothetical protein
VSFSLSDFAYQFPLNVTASGINTLATITLRIFAFSQALTDLSGPSSFANSGLTRQILAMPRESEHFEASLSSLRRILAGYPLTNR